EPKAETASSNDTNASADAPATGETAASKPEEVRIGPSIPAGDEYDDISRCAWTLLVETEAALASGLINQDGEHGRRIWEAVGKWRDTLEGSPPPADEITLDLDAGTMREDLQRTLLTAIKELHKPWQSMVEWEQQRVIRRLEKIAETVTVRAIKVAAAC